MVIIFNELRLILIKKKYTITKSSISLLPDSLLLLLLIIIPFLLFFQTSNENHSFPLYKRKKNNVI